MQHVFDAVYPSHVDPFSQVTESVWTFSKPFSRFLGFFPMGGRSTAIKLSDGTVWAIASTPLSAETKEVVDNLGPVRYGTCANQCSRVPLTRFVSVSYLLAADLDHHFFLSTSLVFDARR